MIELTRLNGNRLILNCDLIKYAEAVPDTTLTLVTGEKLLIGESLEELTERVVDFRAEVLRGAASSAPAALSALHAVRAIQTASKPFSITRNE